MIVAEAGGDSGGGGSEGRKGLYCGSAAKYVRAEPVRSKTPPPSQSAINTCHMHGWEELGTSENNL